MICYVLAMGKQHLGPHVVVGYGIKTFVPRPLHYVTRSPGSKVQIRLTNKPINKQVIKIPAQANLAHF